MEISIVSPEFPRVRYLPPTELLGIVVFCHQFSLLNNSAIRQQTVKPAVVLFQRGFRWSRHSLGRLDDSILRQIGIKLAKRRLKPRKKYHILVTLPLGIIGAGRNIRAAKNAIVWEFTAVAIELVLLSLV